MMTRSIRWTTATVLAAIIVLAVGCTTGLITSAERIESLRHNGLGCPADGPCLIESLSEVSGLITFAIVPPESLSAEFTKLSIICEDCGRTVRGLTLASSAPHAPGGAISFGQGSCVALSRDGYFLTAAHVLDARFVGSPTPPVPSGIHVIVTRDQDGTPVVLPLRVVWRTPPERQSTTGKLAAGGARLGDHPRPCPADACCDVYTRTTRQPRPVPDRGKANRRHRTVGTIFSALFRSDLSGHAVQHR